MTYGAEMTEFRDKFESSLLANTIQVCSMRF